MKQNKQNGSDSTWLTRKALAKLLGVTVSALKQSLLPHIPKTATRNPGPGKPIEYHGPTVLGLWSDRKLARLVKTDADLLLAGGDSPALERYRLARARLAEMDLASRSNETIPRAECHTTMMQLAGVIRRAGETLRRQFGNDAGDILDEALNDFERIVRASIAPADPPSPPAA